jgi:dolichyl-phosphate-mannose--protein O-mannosyl transferase
MMKHRILAIVGFVALFVWALWIVQSTISRAHVVPFERDEISWYFHTEFFSKAFIEKDMSSELWLGYESFDHPQVSKYLYGAFLYMFDPQYMTVRDDLERTYGRWEFYTGIESDPAIVSTEFPPIISRLRQLNVFLTLAIVLEIFLLGWILTRSYLAAIMVSTLLATNELFISAVTVGTSESHALFFSLMALILYFTSLKTKK